MNDLLKEFRTISKQFPESFVELLNKEHRTHQASIIKNIQAILKLYAETARHDARNEAAVDFARQSAEIDTFIPYI